MRTVDCTTCGARFAVPDELFTRAVSGRQRRIVCKRCGVRVVIDGTRATGTEAPWIVTFGEDDDREFTPRQLREAIAMGRIQGSALVWRDGMDEWVALRTVEEFASAFGPRPAAGAAPESPAPSDADGTADSELTAPLDADAVPDADDGSGAREPVAPAEHDRNPSSIPAPQAVALPGARPGLTPPPKPAARDAQAGPPRQSPAAEAQPTARAAPSGGEAGAIQDLFSVESIPPVAVLTDSEVLSLPPSRPARGPSPRVIIPRAARVPTDAERPPLPAAAMPPTAVAPAPAIPDGGFDVDVTDADGLPDAVDVALDDGPAAARADDGERSGRWRPGWLALGGAAGVALVASGLLLMGARDRARDAATPAGEGRVGATDPVAPAPSGAVRRETQDDQPAAATTRRENADAAPPAAPPPAAPSEPADVRAGSPAAATVRGIPGGSVAPAAPVTATGTADRSQPRAATGARSTPVATAAPTPAGAPFDRAAAASALTAASASASSCRRGADPSGTATVTVTFAPSGRVTSVNVAGPPFAGTATGGCIATTLRRATVPPFSGGHVTVSKRIVVQ